MMNDTTRTYPRTLRQAFGMSPEDAQAIYVYRKPLVERILIWLLFRFGWALVLGVVFLLSGCADDLQAHAAVQADLADAIATAAKGGSMSEAIKPKCCGQVRRAGAWRSYPCGKNASMEHEGKHYCKTHHPPTVQARRDASHAKWQAQWDAQRVREQAARDADAEQKRRADAYEQLVERVKELEGALRDAVDCGMVPKSSAEDGGASRYSAQVRVADRIRAALSKALPNAAAKEAGK